MNNLLQSTLGGGISINTEFRPHIWYALADPTQIELVVLNLVLNARDAMENRGTVTIETANAKVGAPEKPEEPFPGDYVMIAVTDTGSGMTKEVLAKAFEPFMGKRASAIQVIATRCISVGERSLVALHVARQSARHRPQAAAHTQSQ